MVTCILNKKTLQRCHQITAMSESLTHWGRVTHICVSDLTSIGSDNGLSPGRRRAIIRTNAGILLIGPLGTNFSEILVGNQTFFSIQKNALENVVCVIASILSRPQWVNCDLIFKHGGQNLPQHNFLLPRLIRHFQLLSHGPLGDFSEFFWIFDFQTNFSNWWLRYLLWNFTHIIATESLWIGQHQFR